MAPLCSAVCSLAAKLGVCLPRASKRHQEGEDNCPVSFYGKNGDFIHNYGMADYNRGYTCLSFLPLIRLDCVKLPNKCRGQGRTIWWENPPSLHRNSLELSMVLTVLKPWGPTVVQLMLDRLGKTNVDLFALWKDAQVHLGSQPRCSCRGGHHDSTHAAVMPCHSWMACWTSTSQW